MGKNGSDGNKRREKDRAEAPPPPEYEGPVLLAPNGSATFPAGTLGEALADLLASGKTVAIILIDMGYPNDLDERHGPLTVGDSQLEMIEIAKGLAELHPGKVKFVEIWIESKHGKKVTVDKLANALPADRIRLPKEFFNSFRNTDLQQQLSDAGVSAALVMGMDGNICVKNTIFGTTSKVYHDGGSSDITSQGLLTLDIPVLTARPVLATGGSVLDAKFNLGQAPRGAHAGSSSSPHTSTLRHSGSNSSGNKPHHGTK